MSRGATIKQKPATSLGNLITITASEVKIEGGTLDANRTNQTFTDGTLIWVGASSSISDDVIRDVKFRNIRVYGIRTGASSGNEVKRLIIEQCDFDLTGALNSGVVFNSYTQDSFIRKNHFANGGTDTNAISVTISSPGAVIEDNFIENNGRIPIEVHGADCENPVVRGNTITGTTGGIVISCSTIDHAVIENNRIFTAAGWAIECGSANARVEGNLIVNVGAGIIVLNYPGVQVLGNTILGTTDTTYGYAVVVQNTGDRQYPKHCKIHDNEFVSTAAIAVYIQEGCDFASIKNNNFRDCTDREIAASNAKYLSISGNTLDSTGSTLGGQDAFLYLVGTMTGLSVTDNVFVGPHRFNVPANDLKTIYALNKHYDVSGNLAAVPDSLQQIGADRGNASVTLTMADVPLQRFNTALTANRIVTLPASGIVVGSKFTVFRLSGATGAFTLTVQDSTPTTLHTFSSGSTNVWAEFTYTGTAWIKTKSGVT